MAQLRPEYMTTEDLHRELDLLDRGARASDCCRESLSMPGYERRGCLVWANASRRTELLRELARREQRAGEA